MADAADARRRAEEALVFMDAALRDDMPPLPSQVKALADAVRALLAAGPEAPPPPSDAVREAATPGGCINGRCKRPETHYHYGAGYMDIVCIEDEVTAAFDRLRANASPAPGGDAVREAAEDVVRDDWWGHYCPCCGATVNHGPECLIGRLAEALSSARAAKGGE